MWQPVHSLRASRPQLTQDCCKKDTKAGQCRGDASPLTCVPAPSDAQTHIPINPTASSFSLPKRVCTPRPREIQTCNVGPFPKSEEFHLCQVSRGSPTQERSSSQSLITFPAPGDTRAAPERLGAHCWPLSPAATRSPACAAPPARPVSTVHRNTCFVGSPPQFHGWSFPSALTEDVTQLSDLSMLIVVVWPVQVPCGRGLPRQLYGMETSARHWPGHRVCTSQRARECPSNTDGR